MLSSENNFQTVAVFRNQEGVGSSLEPGFVRSGTSWVMKELAGDILSSKHLLLSHISLLKILKEYPSKLYVIYSAICIAVVSSIGLVLLCAYY